MFTKADISFHAAAERSHRILHGLKFPSKTRIPKWEWGHEGQATGMARFNMCGPFFGRNLTGIIVWMMSETGTDLNAWNRRIKRDNGRRASLRDLALEEACKHAGTWPHHFLTTRVCNDEHVTYCQRCGFQDDDPEGIPEVCVKTMVDLLPPLQWQYDRANDVPF